MIEKLIKMAKNGMFDIAFLLAEKYNLDEKLFNIMKGDYYYLSFEELKELILLKEKYGDKYLDLCYNLTELYCCRNKLFNLDVSNNINLIILSCYSTKIKELDTSKNVNLDTLCCYDNLLTILDLSKNIKLTFLDCANNPELKHIKLNKQVEGKIIIIKDKHTQIEYVG